MLQMVLNPNTSKMKFYLISSNISGSTGWHWTEEITDRLILFIITWVTNYSLMLVRNFSVIYNFTCGITSQKLNELKTRDFVTHDIQCILVKLGKFRYLTRHHLISHTLHICNTSYLPLVSYNLYLGLEVI